MRWNALSEWRRRLATAGREFAGSGPLHRRHLSDIGVRISVSGIRGKSTAVRWLHDVFADRGYDTYAKVTGVEPLSIYNGTEHEIDRPPKVRLYENERQLRKFSPVDVAIFENQGIRDYTTRLVNEEFVRPHVVFLTNVREDHLDTLGRNRANIVRALARSIPAGTHVVCGERNETITTYLEGELDRRNATVSYVQVPPEHREIPGAELVYGLNPVLRTVDEPPVDDAVLDSYLDQMCVSWTRLPGGRVYDASAVNDPQSTELVRRQLLTNPTDVVQPLVYLREDRRGRTAVFLRYLESLADRGAIQQARVVGWGARQFSQYASFPVVVHEDTSDRPTDVLDDALEDGWPVMLMGNTVSGFMQELVGVIDDRATETGEQWPGQWKSLEPDDDTSFRFRDEHETSIRVRPNDREPDEVVDFLRHHTDVDVPPKGGITGFLFSEDRRYTQRYIPVGADLYLLGATEPAEETDENSSGLVFRRDPASDQFVVSALSEAELVSGSRWVAPAKIAGGIAVSAVSLLFLLDALGVA